MFICALLLEWVSPMANLRIADVGGKDTKSTAFLVLDTESVPDGRLLAQVKYAKESLSAEEAIRKARAEARERSADGSDFISVSFQFPVSICIARVAGDFRLLAVSCLDAPLFRTREMVEQFWRGIGHYERAKLVTFNGRGFDLPLLELAGFRYGLSGPGYYRNRNRYKGDIDILDWFGNFGACRHAGGLDLLAKLIGNPGKRGVAGDQVYEMYREGRLQEINDYCMTDTLDTYFVFLRTRVMTGDISLSQERELAREAREWLSARAAELPVLRGYLADWKQEEPWP